MICIITSCPGGFPLSHYLPPLSHTKGAKLQHEDVCVFSCMCNIVCNGHNDNPVCGSDGITYDTPCHVREASCLKQLKIDIKHVGRCQELHVCPEGGEASQRKFILLRSSSEISQAPDNVT
ncbi:hypothetical protein XENOCAPTIV_013495 [Xenoophorus captivus]|uniref:Kazal-like domain-containing protein n=1 Tax=Xenoophorus captivus TaxID=1517983 RepID=A0ABV0R074_9TELE